MSSAIYIWGNWCICFWCGESWCRSSWIDSGESFPTELLSPNFWCKLASPPASRCYCCCWLVPMVVLYSCYSSPPSLAASQRPLVWCTSTTYLHQAGLHQRHNGALRRSFRYVAPMHINRNGQSGNISEKSTGQHHPTLARLDFCCTSYGNGGFGWCTALSISILCTSASQKRVSDMMVDTPTSIR